MNRGSGGSVFRLYSFGGCLLPYVFITVFRSSISAKVAFAGIILDIRDMREENIDAIFYSDK
jgi:hypothetical protein